MAFLRRRAPRPPKKKFVMTMTCCLSVMVLPSPMMTMMMPRSNGGDAAYGAMGSGVTGAVYGAMPVDAVCGEMPADAACGEIGGDIADPLIPGIEICFE